MKRERKRALAAGAPFVVAIALALIASGTVGAVADADRLRRLSEREEKR